MSRSTDHKAPETAAAGGAALAGASAHNPTPSAVDVVRGLPIIPEAAIPPVASTYGGIPADEMSQLLKMEGKQYAENDGALSELIAKGDTKLKADLGNSTPSVATLKALQENLRASIRSKALLEKAAAFAADKNSVVQNDVRAALRKAEKNLLHEMEDQPGLAAEYKALKTILDQRSEAVTAGIAAAKAKTKAEPPK